MDALIPVFSRLQDVFATLGRGDTQIELPQIVVVGSQSAGKSSLIEGIVGRDFLPRGTGIVTRRPLLLHLVHVPIDDPRRNQLGVPKKDDWAVFEHKKDAIFTNFDLVRREIEEETDRVSGRNKGISHRPITLRIFSSKVVDLSLIDLPGITKLPVGDQPPDIEVQIHRLILSYIVNPIALVLAVTPANQDFATSEPLKLAREVDPNGDRTIAVLTKLDLMDKGTDATNVLTGKTVPVKLGIIGVVNRSQADIIANKSVDECLKDESRFLLKNYPALADRNGIQYLSKTLNRLLMKHIRECLPRVRARIAAMTNQYRTLLNACGDPVVDKSRTLLQLITEFSSAYTSVIEGTRRHVVTNELTGGARISYIFRCKFAESLDRIDPMDELSPIEILTAIQNATGTRASLFIPASAFELLIKDQIERLLEPALCCVDLIHGGLVRTAHGCGLEQKMKRFPKLAERIGETLESLLADRLQSAKNYVTDLVYCEMAYINTAHPDFIEASLIEEKPTPKTSQSAAENGCADGDHLKPAARTVSHPSADFAKRSASPGVVAVESTKKSSRLWPFNRSHERNVESTEKSKTTSAAIADKTFTRPLTKREERDYKLFERLIRDYFAIVRRNVQDMVPKAIMRFMVNHVKENLQNELLQKLYRGDMNADELLSEDEGATQRRKEAAEMLNALNKANLVIGEIRETHLW